MEEVGVAGAVQPAPGKEVVWTPELDVILREGYARGWAGARQALDKIQRLRPKWRSYIIWERALQLGFRREYVVKRPPWSAADDAALMDFAQEQSIETIAGWLHRPAMAVRKRFSKLRESARVQDNYTQLELARDLRVSPKTVRRWEAAGVLKRKAGRITHESLELFLRKCGSEINYDALDEEMQEWLRDCAGFVPPGEQQTARGGVRKHLDRVGVCPRCGRKTRGNAHGRHVKSCAKKVMAKKAGGIGERGNAAAKCSPIH
jgi:DNA-binding XRE family transcriptional regulator